MLHPLQALLVPAVFERLVLVVNHVVGAEPVALARLVPHRGRAIALELQQWPAWLPSPPQLKLRITPAGLFEWCGLDDTAPPDLSVQVQAAQPAMLFARALWGEAPPLQVSGHAALATDIQWLVDNLRWDVEDDLARIVGAGPARELSKLARAVAAAVRESARTLSDMAQRLRRGGDGAGPPSR
jgi:ubiquinone biosynthesis protein UbiJ